MKKLQQQKGFTLVELAIVLTIVGLLIGGILKGQQLIANARVTAQMAQVQAIEAATTTFSDTYAGLPGDLATAATRLPAGGTTGCGGAACVNGNGDGNVGALGATPTATAAGETLQYFLQLSDGGLISGISSAALTFGGGLPQAKIGGGLVVNALNGTGAGYPLAGLYVTAGSANLAANLTAPAAGAGDMNPNQAAQIDRKMDDGVENTGSVVGSGASCAAAGVYTETSSSKDCAMSWRIQQ